MNKANDGVYYSCCCKPEIDFEDETQWKKHVENVHRYKQDIEPFTPQGFWIKITSHLLECGCFCSAGDCEEEFKLGETVVQAGGNLFHRKCFGDPALVDFIEGVEGR